MRGDSPLLRREPKEVLQGGGGVCVWPCRREKLSKGRDGEVERYYGLSGNGKLLHGRGLRLFMSVIVEGKTRTND